LMPLWGSHQTGLEAAGPAFLHETRCIMPARPGQWVRVEPHLQAARLHTVPGEHHTQTLVLTPGVVLGSKGPGPQGLRTT
jgi:hypothetical protein